MAPVDRSRWHRMLSGVSSVVTGRSKAEAEILREMTDVFKELAHLSEDLGAVWRSLEDAKAKLDAQGVVVAALAEVVNEQIECGDESMELIGRLLQSTRARLEALEERQGHT